MKMFTLKMNAALCMVLMLWIVSGAASASPSKATDFYGKYKFTSKMELTELGQTKYADVLKAECDVELTSDENGNFDMVIKGLAGGGIQQVTSIDYEKGKIVITNPNGVEGLLWSELAMADADGNYPYGFENSYGDLEWTYDSSEPLTFTIPDFTAVVCNYADSTAEVAAKFTECKLVMVEGIQVELPDLSAKYHFKGEQAMENSPVPTEFDMSIVSVDGSKESYNVTITFADNFGELKFENCPFDGESLTLAFDKTYVAESVFLCEQYSETPMTGKIVFKTIKNSASLTLDGNFICFGKSKVEGTPSGQDIEYVQYYTGTAVNMDAEPAVDYTGRYTIKGTRYDISENQRESAEFTMEIIYVNDVYYLKELLGKDIYDLNYGGIPCAVEDGKLKIPVSSEEKVYYLDMVMGSNGPEAYDILLNGQGEKGGEVEFVVNEDGSVTLGDFFVARQTMGENFTPTGEKNTFYYSEMTGTKEVTGVAAVAKDKARNVYAQGGVIYVKGGTAEKLQVFDTGGHCVFNGTASQVNGLSKGLYIVKCAGSVTKVIL